MAPDKEKIVSFLNEQIAQADFRAEAYVLNEENEKKAQRNVFVKVKSY